MCNYLRVVLCAILTVAGMGWGHAETASVPVPPPVFSHEAGFHEQPFQLTLAHPDPDVQIFYTLDGSVPDPDNLDGTSYQYKNQYAEVPEHPAGPMLTRVYQTRAYADAIPVRDGRSEPDRLTHISTSFGWNPSYFPGPRVEDKGLNFVIRHTNRAIREANRAANRAQEKMWRLVWRDDTPHVQKDYLPMIAYRPPHEYLYKGTVVRALAVDAGQVHSPVVTGVFFVGRIDDFTLPVVSLVIPEPAMFDYAEGVFVAGKDYDDWLHSDDFRPGGGHQRPANWTRRGSDVAAHLSIFDSRRPVQISSDVDIRVHGGGSRSYPMKPIRVYPRNDQGMRGLAYDIFDPDKGPSMNRFILRNAGQEYRRDYLKDAAVHQIMAGLNFGTQRYVPMVFFLNGEYNGIRNLRDRQDQYYLADVFNLPSRKVDLLKNNSVVSRGSTDHWDGVLHYITEQSRQDPGFLSGLEALIDVDSYIDYHVANVFIANVDWPGNNVAWWRYRGRARTGADNANTAHESPAADGRWRWLLYDTDAAFRFSGSEGIGVGHNTLAFATEAGNPRHPNPDWSTRVLRTLLENPLFRDRFITRFSDLLNTTFQSQRMVDIIRQTQAGIEPEMPRHIHRWSAPSRMGRWRNNIDDMVKFAQQRPANQRAHLQEFFSLAAPYAVSVDVSDRASGVVRLNTLTLGATDDATRAGVLAFPWKGDYFEGLPLRLEAVPGPGYRFSHWEGSGLTPQQASDRVLTLQPDGDVAVRAVMAAH